MVGKPGDHPANKLLRLICRKWQKISALKTSWKDLP
ncbi:hypothetical protein QFZ94_008938 [Paraburkholderia sp. JPY465]